MTSVHPYSDQNWTEETARSSNRALTIVAFLIFLAAASLDLFNKQMNFAMLLSVPLLLLASGSTSSARIWRYVAVAVVTVYVVHYLKHHVVTTDTVPFISYRLFNRTFTALSVLMLGLFAQAWLYWQHECTLLDYLDRYDEDEVNSTAGFAACVILGTLIAAVDFVAPANYNLPILFTIPLYLSSWLRDRRILWGTAFALIGLTLIGLIVSPPPTVPGIAMSIIVINRGIAMATLLILAAILHVRIGVQAEAEKQHEPEVWYR